MSLAEARENAAEALRNISLGSDPALSKQAEEDTSYQFATVVDEFVRRHCRVHNKASTAKEHERLLRKHFASTWGRRDVRDIKQKHVNTILDGLLAEGKPSEANHALGVVKTLFRWCVDRDILVTSPCQKVKKPAKSQSRTRALTDRELREVWRAAGEDGYPFGHMTQLLVLTGQRRGEVTQMRWSQIDFDAKTWLIPAELSKNGRPHLVPLSTPVIDLLKTMPRLHQDVLFPARGSTSAVISGFTRAKLRLDRTSGVADWTLHDLRRTTATHLGKLGTAPHVIERVLNHVSGSFSGVAGVYNRHPYFEEMRDALQRWADWVLMLSDLPKTHDRLNVSDPQASLENSEVG
jgi:integrase